MTWDATDDTPTDIARDTGPPIGEIHRLRDEWRRTGPNRRPT